MAILQQLGDGLLLATRMGWETFWALVVGFTIAGAVEVFVSEQRMVHVLGGSGPVGVVVACTIGVVVGAATSVCSVGNVPFSLILWRGGIPFGGVMSFLLADLIVPTIVDAYRRYYGARMAASLFVLIFAAAVIAGVVVHYLWTMLGLVPAANATAAAKPGAYTARLNAAAAVLLLAQVGVARRGDAFVTA